MYRAGYPRVTHPSAALLRRESLDLHVLGTPPAFILSQDQTLKIKFRILYRQRFLLIPCSNKMLYPLRCYLKISGMVCMAFELFVRTKYICCSVFKVHLKLSFCFLFSCPLSRTSIILSAFTFYVNTFLKLFLSFLKLFIFYLKTFIFPI